MTEHYEARHILTPSPGDVIPSKRFITGFHIVIIDLQHGVTRLGGAYFYHDSALAAFILRLYTPLHTCDCFFKLPWGHLLLESRCIGYKRAC
jgi:hypothetical protein